MKNLFNHNLYKMYKWDSEEIKVQIGIIFKFYRLRKGLSQFQLGNEIDLSKDYIGRIERGKTNLSIEIIVNICNFLELDIVQLVSKINSKKIESIKDEINLLEAKFKNQNKRKS